MSNEQVMVEIKEVDLDVEIVDAESEEAKNISDMPQFTIFGTKDIERSFIQYIDEELEQGYHERNPRFDRLETWRRMANNENACF